MNKKVSIVVCTYNGEKYISEQLDSLLRQTYPISEIICQDDCSSDGTVAILKEYEQRFPDIFKVYQNEVNLFWNQNFYSAILKANGDYIALCDQDDIWDEHKIERQMEAVDSNTMIHACSSYLWNDEGLTPLISKPVSLPEICFLYCYCGHQMLLRSDVKKYIPIGQSADLAHDKFLSIIGVYFGNLQTSEQCLIKWRRHASSSTGKLTVDNISGKKKIIVCLKSLLKGDKSTVITKACKKYEKVLDFATQTSITPYYQQGKTICKLYHSLGKQTVLSYIYASLIMLFRGKMIICPHTEIKHSIKAHLSYSYNALTWCYRWWYVHRTDL